MTQQITNGQMDNPAQRRSRGPTKKYPPINFEEALFLPTSILEHGFDGEIQRLTLLRELDFSPTSSKARNLIGGSHKYGLTEGSYTAQSLVVTDAGRIVSGPDSSPQEAKEKGFELAISQFSPFKTLYDKLKGQRLRDGAILHDELRRAGVSSADCQNASEIFTANLRFLGLAFNVAGSDYVRSIEQALEELPEGNEDSPPEPPQPVPVAADGPAAEGNGKGAPATNRPALHVDIQVHIDPTSSAEQIDQIFASMAKHLYGNES